MTIAVAAFAAAGAALVVTTGGIASATSCTDSWTNASGGTWDTATDWSTGLVPVSTDTACISKSGTYTVVVGNETISVAGLVLGGSGSHPTLQIGNGGSGAPNITVTTLTNNSGATLSFGWEGTLTVSSFTNTGTFEVPASSFSATLDITNLDNKGTFSVGSQTAYSLPTSASGLLNDATGTLSVASGQTLTVSSPTSSQTGTVTQDGVIDNSGSLAIDDTLDVEGGSICGPADVGASDQGNLTFTGAVATGPACGAGFSTDQIIIGNVTGTLTGNIPAAYTVAIGNAGSGAPNFTIAGAITNAGTLSFGWDGTLTSTAGFTNTGTFEVPASSFFATLDITNLDNKGTFSVGTQTTYSLPTSASDLLNDTTGTLSVASGQTLTVSSPSGQTGTVTQDGVIDNSGSLAIDDTLDVEGGSICGPADVGASGQGNLTFTGAVATGPACGAGFTTDQILIGNVTGTLTGNIPAAYTVAIGNAGSGAPNITLAGAITNAGTLSFGWTGTLTSTAGFTNTGTFEVPASSFSATLDITNLDNKGTFSVGSQTTYSLPTSASVLLNDTTGTLSVASAQTLTVSSPSGQTGTVTEDGLIASAGHLTDLDTLSILGGTSCGKAVHVGTDGGAGQTLSFASRLASGAGCSAGLAKDRLFMANIRGTVSGNIPTGWTLAIGDGGSSFANVTLSGTTKNAGTLEPGFGATVTDTSALTNTGTLDIPRSGYTTTVDLGGLTSSKTIAIKGSGAINLPSGMSLTSTSHGSITVSKNKTLTLSNSLVNDGILTINAGGRVDVTGNYSQVGSGSELVPQLASTTSYGVLNVTGTASLTGILAPELVPHFTPPSGSVYQVLTSTGLGGTTFTTVDGSFTAQYISSDSDVQLTAD